VRIKAWLLNHSAYSKAAVVLKNIGRGTRQDLHRPVGGSGAAVGKSIADDLAVGRHYNKAGRAAAASSHWV
jgi:hypothetical protein